MLKRYISLLFWLIIAAIVIIVSLANRNEVIVSFDPVLDPPTLSLKAPLFIIIQALFLLGVLFGAIITWISQGHHRKALRRTRHRLKQLEQAMENKERDMRQNLAKVAENARINAEHNKAEIDTETDKREPTSLSAS